MIRFGDWVWDRASQARSRVGAQSSVVPAVSSGAPLDPHEWSQLTQLGHRMVDDMVEHLASVRDRPVWRELPSQVEERLRSTELPLEGVGAEQAYQDFLRDVLPYPIGNTHPRFWGWVIGSGTPLGVWAEMLAATMNANVSGLRGSPPLVEEQVIRWLAQLLGYQSANGLLLSGASVANLVGLNVGLVARAGFDVAREGLGRAPHRPVLYASTESHFSILKAVRTLGLGASALRKIPVDDEYRMDLSALEEAVQKDRASGLKPFAVVGNAGTVNQGAFDPLDRIADFARQEDLWFHVDGAFGAFAVLDQTVADLARGMERADSLAFDLHKWMLVPIEAGAVLISDADAHRATYEVEGSYVSQMPGGIGRDATIFAERGPQLTRGFKALKVWLALKAYGVDAYADVVRRNVSQARYLSERVGESAELELLAPTPLNVVNFRYRGAPEPMDDRILDGLNRTLLVTLQEKGIAAPSHTILDGRFSIRVCLTNHRTKFEDLDLLVQETTRIGRRLAKKGFHRPAEARVEGSLTEGAGT